MSHAFDKGMQEITAAMETDLRCYLRHCGHFRRAAICLHALLNEGQRKAAGTKLPQTTEPGSIEAMLALGAFEMQDAGL